MLRSFLLAAGLGLASLVACGDGTTTTTTAKGGPAFEGVSWVVPDDVGHLVVAWKPAPDAVDYRVYVSRIQGRELKTTPAFRTNATSVTVTPDEPNAKYYVIVRAANVAGIEDGNAVEKSAVAAPDKTPPDFAGAKSAAPAGNAGAKVSWDPATDDFTPPEAIVYDVFAGPTRTALVHVATSGPGDTTITLDGLGQPTQPFVFSVRARDIANNISPEGPPVSTPLGQDATPPVFAGCDTVMAVGGKGATLTWKPATDNHSPASAISYEVYLATKASGEDLTAAPVAKVTGATTTTLTALTPGTTYFVLCRARDEAGNLDANLAEKSFTTASDVTAPSFAGITDFTFDKENRTVTLSWAAATDDKTAKANILYDVFESRVSGQYDFDAAPRATSAPGATSVIVNNLASRAALNWVVRARDEVGNRDTNLVEKSGTTVTSFSIDVLELFARNCAVVGCHVTGPLTGNQNLAPEFAYDQIVNVVSAENKPMPRITPGDLNNSYMYLKISGTQKVGLQMPAPQTGNALSAIDKDVLTSWILDGAPRN